MTNVIDITEESLTDEDLDQTIAVGDEAVSEQDELATEESVMVPVTQMPVDSGQLRKIIEGAILAAGQPMTIARMLDLFDPEVAPSKDEIIAAYNRAEYLIERQYLMQWWSDYVQTQRAKLSLLD